MVDCEFKNLNRFSAADEITITKLICEVGNAVNSGRNILASETDLSHRKIESTVTGRLKQNVVENDPTVSAGARIAILDFDQPLRRSMYPPTMGQTSCTAPDY